MLSFRSSCTVNIDTKFATSTDIVPDSTGSITLCGYTSYAIHADSTSGVKVKLMFASGWSNEQQLFTSVSEGTKVCTTFESSSWPTSAQLTIDGTNAWGFWKLTLEGKRSTTLVLDPAGSAGSAYGDTGFWLDVDTDGKAPSSLTYGVPTSSTVDSRALCCTECNLNTECRYYTYVTATMACTLHSTAAGIAVEAGTQSGENSEVSAGLIQTGSFFKWNLTHGSNFRIETSDSSKTSLAAGWHTLTVRTNKASTLYPSGYQDFFLDGQQWDGRDGIRHRVGRVEKLVTADMHAIGNNLDSHDTKRGRAPWGPTTGMRVFEVGSTNEYPPIATLEESRHWKFINEGTSGTDNAHPYLKGNQGYLQVSGWSYGPWPWNSARCGERKGYLRKGRGGIYAGATGSRNQNSGDADTSWAFRRGQNTVLDKPSAYDWTDYELTVALRSDHGRSIGVMFRYKDMDNYYRFMLENDNGRCMDIEKIVDGQPSFVNMTYTGGVEAAWDRNIWGRVRVTVIGSKIDVYLQLDKTDDVNIATLYDEVHVMSAIDSSLTSGSIGLATHHNTNAKFMGVQVRDLSATGDRTTANYQLGEAMASVGLSAKTIGASPDTMAACLRGSACNAAQTSSWAVIGVKGTAAADDALAKIPGGLSLRGDHAQELSSLAACRTTKRSVVENAPLLYAVRGVLPQRTLRAHAGAPSDSPRPRSTGYTMRSSGKYADAARHFGVNPQTGQLYVKSPVDFEANSTIVAQVLVRESMYDSGWFAMSSQAGADSFKEVEHGMRSVGAEGLLVTVRVRAVDGPNQGYVFESTNIGTADSDYWHSYGGLQIGYDGERVRMWAPSDNNYYSRRHGQSSLIHILGGYGMVNDEEGRGKEFKNVQNSHAGMVRVSVGKDSMPQFDSGWTRLKANDGKASFLMLQHGLGGTPGRVKVLVRVLDGNNKHFIFPAVGSQQTDDDMYSHEGSVLYAYSPGHVRVWAPTSRRMNDARRHMVYIDDGWAGTTMSQVSDEADVRVMAWADDDDADFDSGWFDMYSNGDSYKEVSHELGTMPEKVLVQVKSKNGYTNYVFDGIGANSNSDYRHWMHYGGVVFGYNENQVRMWAPSLGLSNHQHGNIICVSDNWYGSDVRKSEASVRVRAWGKFGGMVESTDVELNILDVNEPPTVEEAYVELYENQTAPVLVHTVVATDPDKSTLGYNITAGNIGNTFSIDTKTGAITLVGPLNYEVVDVFTLIVAVSDGVNEVRAEVVVQILNLNDRPVIQDYYIEVMEDSAVNMLVGKPLNGTDDDVDQTILFKIISGNIGGAFKISGCAGQIRVAENIIDYEDKMFGGFAEPHSSRQYILTVMLVDDGVPPLNDTATLTVQVMNKNDQPEFADTSRNITENSVVGAPVGEPLYVFDPDGDDLVFAIDEALTKDDALQMFAVENTTGQLIMRKQGPNFEARPAAGFYTLYMTVTDKGLSPCCLQDTAKVTVSVLNANDLPVMTDSVFSIAETITLGARSTVVGGEAEEEEEGEGEGEGPDPEDEFGEGGGSNSTKEETPTWTWKYIGSPLAYTDEDSRSCDSSVGENGFCGDSVTFSLQGDAYIFDLSSAGQLRVNSSDAHLLDFESKSQYILSARGVDKWGGIVDSLVTVQVLNENDAPIMQEYEFSISEASARGTLLGVLNGTDVDTFEAGGKLTYDIVGGNEEGRFVIDETTAALSLRTMLDFETTPKYVLTVSATDNGEPAIKTETSVTVSVLDDNDAPVMNCDGSVPTRWNTQQGTNMIDGLIEAPGTAGVNGVTTFFYGNQPDAASCAEECKASSSCKSYTYFASGYWKSGWASGCYGRSWATPDVSVVDTLGKTTLVSAVKTTPCQRFFVAENEANGVDVGTALEGKANDPEGDAIAFIIAGGNIGGAFSIDTATGQLTVANTAMLDFETHQLMDLTLKLKDNGSPSMNANYTIQVQLADVNEAPTLIAMNRTLAQSLEVGKNVGEPLESNDQDRDTVAFALVGVKDVKGNDASSYFSLGAAGQVKLTKTFVGLVLEDIQPLTVSLNVSDGLLSTPSDLIVYVSKSNFYPVASDAAVAMDENSKAGTPVTTVAVTDANPASEPFGQHSFEITAGNIKGGVSEAELVPFVIDADGQITVQEDTSLDFEGIPAYTLTVLVTDKGGLTDTATITVSLNDLNEAPVVADGVAATVLSVAENTAAGQTVDSAIKVHDDDADTLTFTLTAGDAGGAFTIDPASAMDPKEFRIKVANSSLLNYEGASDCVLKPKPEYNGTCFDLTVTVFDGILSTNAKVHVFVTDVNEEPVVLSSNSTVIENAPGGTEVVRVNFTEQDRYDVYPYVTEDGRTIDAPSYSIVGGNDEGLFEIDVVTGTVSVKASDSGNVVDFERTSEYSLMILVKDGGGLRGTGTAVVHVVDENDLTITTVQVVDGESFSSAMWTRGGDEVVITGSNFGPEDASAGVSANYTVLTGTLAGRVYEATGCSVVAGGNTAIRCTSVEGAGAGPYQWKIALHTSSSAYSPGYWSLLSADAAGTTTKYFAPHITGMDGHTDMPTTGNWPSDVEGKGPDSHTVTLTGTNFGPMATSVSALYSTALVAEGAKDTFYAEGCEVTVAHTTMVCDSTVGAGKGLSWKATVDEQGSSGTDPDNVALASWYKPPTIIALSTPWGAGDGIGLLETSGGQDIVFKGINFGSNDGFMITGIYGANSTYRASCALSTIKEDVVEVGGSKWFEGTVTCKTTPGVGQAHKWQLEVANQISDNHSPEATSYKPPVVSRITGLGSRDANTEGGQQVILHGTQFGPVGTVLLVQYGERTDKKDETDRLTAQSCRVSFAHGRIDCLTAAGTGKNHDWKVTVGADLEAVEQQTSAIYDANTYYGQPFVSTLDGAGSSQAVTDGKQLVVIRGGNFGTQDMARINNVTYGKHGKEFIASGCTITEAHKTIECDTGEGAGSGLKWLVTVDEQRSSQPTTNYGLPNITAISMVSGGGPAHSLQSQGAEWVHIDGYNFGTDTLLDSVTYGWTGVEYTARNCTLVTDHRRIKCKTVAGWGADHVWFVTVRAQANELNTELSATTSYSPPKLLTLTPSNGRTNGNLVISDHIEIVGTNLGPLGNSEVNFAGRKISPTTHKIDTTSGKHTLTMACPEGYGKDRPVFISVGDGASSIVKSNELPFSYDKPVIETVNAKSHSYNKIIVRIFGESFGLEYMLNGENQYEQNAALLVNGRVLKFRDDSWHTANGGAFGHAKITAVFGFPEHNITQGTVQVVTAAPSFFADLKNGVPLATALATAANNAQVSEEKRYDNYSPAIVRYQYCPINADTGTIDDADCRDNDDDGSSPPTAGGGELRVMAEHAGASPSLHVRYTNPSEETGKSAVQCVRTTSGLTMPCVTWSDCTGATMVEMRCTVPPGQGKAALFLDADGMQSIPVKLEYQAPALQLAECTNPEYGSGDAFSCVFSAPTTGGLIKIAGSNLGVAPVVMLDGLSAADSIVCTYAYGASNASSHCTNEAHQEFSMRVPPGEGVHKIEVHTGKGSTLSDAALTTGARDLLYRPPVVTNITGEFGKALGKTNGTTLLTILGENFGSDNSSFGRGSVDYLCGHVGDNAEGAPFSDGCHNAQTLIHFIDRSSRRRLATKGSTAGTCVVETLMHDRLTCRVQPGQGYDLDVQVSVSGIAQEGPFEKFSFLPPHVFETSGGTDGIGGFFPRTGPTAGGTTVTLRGENFGVVGNVTMSGVALAPTCLSADMVGCVLSYSQTEVTFRTLADPGTGAKAVIDLLVGGQGTGQDEFLGFGYDAPEVTDISPKTGPTNGLEEGRIPFAITITGANFGQSDVYAEKVLRVELAHELGQSFHGFSNVIDDSCFDEPPAVSRLDGSYKPCIAKHTHTEIVFYPGWGFGKDLAVQVQLSWTSKTDCNNADPALRARCSCDPATAPRPPTSNCTDISTWSYDPPRVSFASPNQPDAMGEEIVLMGDNFGERSYSQFSPVRIFVDDDECTRAMWLPPDGFMQNRPYLACTLSRVRVGFRNLTVHVANQTVTYTKDDRIMLSECKPGYYGQIDEYCMECPIGATCDTDYDIQNQRWSEPVAKAGFYGFTPLSTQDASKCDASFRDPEGNARGLNPDGSTMDLCKPEVCPASLDGAPHPCRLDPDWQTQCACPYFLPCEPKSACLAATAYMLGNCSEAYAGQRCSLCAPGHYRVTGKCEVCPKCPVCMYLIFIGAGILGATIAHYLSKKRIECAVFSIGVDYFQVLAMLMRADVAWPAAVRNLYHWLSIFNFNLDLLAPECSLPSFPYWQKWVVIEMLPLFCFLIFISFHLAKVFHKRVVLGRTKKLHSHGHRVIGYMIMAFYFLYLYITRTTLEIWNCTETDPPDGHEYLEAVFEKCYEPGGTQMMLLPWSIIFFFLYTVGYPAFCGLIIFSNVKKIKEDQMLRARNTGQTRATNPACHEFRKRYKELYYRYKPHHYYWMLLILCRKFLMAFTGLMFRKTPSFQLAIALLVMFAAYALQVRHQPYMSESEKALVNLKYEQAMAAKDKMEVRVNKRGSMGRQGSQRMKAKVKLGHNQDEMIKKKAIVANYFWNYNTVESTLLCSAVLVMLAGVMFQSDRYAEDGTKMAASADQEALGYITLFIIIISMIYFFAVLATEIAIGLGFGDRVAEKVMSVMGAGKNRNGTGNKKAARATMKSSNPVSNGADGLDSSASAEDQILMHSEQERRRELGLADEDQFQMAAETVNPMMAGGDKKQAKVIEQQQEDNTNMAETIEKLQEELRNTKKRAAELQQLARYSSQGASRNGGMRAGASRTSMKAKQSKKKKKATFSQHTIGEEEDIDPNESVREMNADAGAGLI
jgi:hypothetical protein